MDGLELTETYHRQRLEQWQQEVNALELALAFAKSKVHESQSHLGTIAVIRMRQAGLLQAASGGVGQSVTGSTGEASPSPIAQVS